MATPTSARPPITTTGMRGFLMWFNREQPGLFAKIAPNLPKAAPKAFGNYLTDAARRQRLYRAKSFAQRAGMGGFGQTSAAYSLPELTVSAPALAPVTVNYNSALMSAPITSAYTAYASSPNAVAYSAGSTPSLPPIAAAANTGSLSTPVASAVGSVIGAAASVYMTNQQAALMQSAVQTNLQRAAAGLPPLNTSLAALGVPTVGGTGVFSGTSGVLLLGGLALAAVLLSGK